MSFRTGPVTVEVPATSANLGPGYDCLGLALDLCDTLSAEVTDGPLAVEVTGEGADDVPRDASHLVVRAMELAFAELGAEPPGLRLACTNRIPHARGLGSSSAAIVGGIALARALVVDGVDRMDDEAALALANRIEGHPDNVAPALLGGFVICGQSGGEVWAHRAPVDPGISAVAFVPPGGVETELARGLLPDQVPHAEAAANTGRAALLVAALAGAPEHLLRGTEDFLHQRYREPAMPQSLALVEELRADGAAAFISGAGPTVLALVTARAVDSVARQGPRGWAVHRLAVSDRGVQHR